MAEYPNMVVRRAFNIGLSCTQPSEAVISHLNLNATYSVATIVLDEARIFRASGLACHAHDLELDICQMRKAFASYNTLCNRRPCRQRWYISLAQVYTSRSSAMLSRLPQR